MKAIGALPTEERVQRMSEVQWLYCHYNINKDEEEEEIKWKARLDYLGLYIRPDVARSVIEADLKGEKQKENGNVSTSRTSVEKKKVNSVISEDGNTEFVVLDTDINEGFESELRKALSGENISEQEFTELPDSQNAGNPFETQEDFLARVLANQNLIGMEDLKGFGDVPIGFEDGEEYIEHLQNEQNLANEKIKKEDEKLTEEDIYRQYGIDLDDIDIIEVPE